MELPRWKDILEAHVRISSLINRTPVFTSSAINSIAGCEISFKCENLQKQVHLNTVGPPMLSFHSARMISEGGWQLIHQVITLPRCHLLPGKGVLPRTL
jgi:hypothetical protein